MSVSIEFDVAEVIEAVGLVGPALERNIPKALQLGAGLVVAEAKQNHDYTDRTGELTNSIMADPVVGSFAAGTLEVTVGAGAPHGGPIEFGSKPHVIPKNKKPKHRKVLRWEIDGGFAFAKWVEHPGTKEYAFLSNALDAKFPEIVDIAQDALDASFAEAGFEL